MTPADEKRLRRLASAPEHSQDHLILLIVASHEERFDSVDLVLRKSLLPMIRFAHGVHRLDQSGCSC
jgi:hypothetical protein